MRVDSKEAIQDWHSEIMNRAFINQNQINSAQNNQDFHLDQESAHRFEKVLRLKPGDRVELFDGHGTILQGTLGTGSVLKKVHLSHIPKPKQTIILCQALVPMEKLEQITQHATELAVAEIILFKAHRSQVDFKHKLEDKLERLRRIAQDASRQCGRAWIPALSFSKTILEGNSWGKKYLAHPKASQTLKPTTKNISLVIGPEGGFSAKELHHFQALGAQTVQLAQYVLRTETASLAALAQIFK